MAAADIAAVDFNKMTPLNWPAACGRIRWGRSASQSTASNASTVVIGRKQSREYLTEVNGTALFFHDHYKSTGVHTRLHAIPDAKYFH